MTNGLKIVFAGTPEIARLTLENILKHQFNVGLVLTQPDRPAGRGMKLTPSPVKLLALEHGIGVFQPLSFKNNPDAIQKIRDFAPDIMVVVAYGLILPAELLSIPRLGCINIHVSLLPRWRGAAPIQRAVLAGDKFSGVTIMQMDAGLDTGAALLTEQIEISEDDTAGSLHDKLAVLGAAKVVEYLTNPAAYSAKTQSEDGVSYAAKLSKEEALIDWSEPSELIARKIRGYNPFPGSYSYLNGQLHKFWQAKLVQSVQTKVLSGTITHASEGKLVIACGSGTAIEVIEIQEAGAKRKTVVQYLQGKSDLVGQQFVMSNQNE